MLAALCVERGECGDSGGCVAGRVVEMLPVVEGVANV